MLETIRQFAEEQLVTSGAAGDARNAHARHFAGREADILALWDSPRQREAYGWFTTEFAKLADGSGGPPTTALVAAAHRSRRTVVVVAPTGKAVDVAVREGAGDTGYTVAKALASLRDETLRLDRQTLVIVDEAGMVGTDDLRQLLTATTKAAVKTVLVGDAHQLAPVKARGGMFAQLCSDLPWAQKLSDVWRMRDPDERAASLALRDGGPAPLRRAVGWYASRGRLHTGDEIAMAHDALAAYRADIADGKVTLLVCDTEEMADALNRRIHDDTIAADAPTVIAARGHRIGVGDLIISRRNDPTVGVFDATDINTPADPVRNGNRWRVYAVDTVHHRVAARWLSDGARAAFSGGLSAPAHHPRVCGHRALRPGRHRRHHSCGARRNHQPRTAIRRFDPRPRVQRRLPLRAQSGGDRARARPARRAAHRHAAAAAARPPSSCAPSSPPATNRPTPPTTSPHKLRTVTIYRIAFAGSWTAALVPYTAGTRPTKTGATPTPNSSSNGSAGSTSTRAAASSTAASGASTTASAFTKEFVSKSSQAVM